MRVTIGFLVRVRVRVRFRVRVGVTFNVVLIIGASVAGAHVIHSQELVAFQ